jgi:hypothetical protein
MNVYLFINISLSVSTYPVFVALLRVGEDAGLLGADEVGCNHFPQLQQQQQQPGIEPPVWPPHLANRKLLEAKIKKS